MSPPTSSNGLRAAQDIVLGRHDFHLEARDVAMVVLVKEDLQNRSVPGFVIDLEDLRSLSGKVDVFEGSHPGASERRLTESIGRLVKAECLSRADMARLRSAQDADYQLTALGEAVAEWQIKQTRFDGEPLGAVLAAFNLQLNGIHEGIPDLATHDDWREKVTSPMHYVVRELLSAVQRHQRSLDRAHEDIRSFVPSLLKQSSEDSIGQCKQVIDSVMKTIRDLVHVTVDVSNAAFRLLDLIEECGLTAAQHEVSGVCEDVRRRLETIVEWTNQRHHDWGVHFETVHSYLRFVAMVDRSRKVTEALKKAVSESPQWSLTVTHSAPHLAMRDRPAADNKKSVVRRPRLDFTSSIENVGPDRLKEKINQLVAQGLEAGFVRWTDVVTAMLLEIPAPRVISKLPIIMQSMIQKAPVNDAQRNLVRIGNDFLFEELEVRRD